MSRFFLCLCLVLGCGPQAFPPSDSEGLFAPDASTPPEGDVCLPFAPGFEACTRALERLNHCCWDAFGPSRAFASGLGGQELCTRVRASGRNPVTACEEILRTVHEVDVTKSSCTFDATTITTGATLGVPLCCCHRGLRCTGTPTRCE